MKKYLFLKKLERDTDCDFFKGKKEIVVFSPSVVSNDAVGNDVVIGCMALQEQGYRVYLLALSCDNQIKNNEKICLINYEQALEILSNKNNLLFYHHSVFCEKAYYFLLSINSRVIVKYHNVTPGIFFKKYSKKQVEKSEQGILQIKEIVNFGIKKDFFYMPASLYNLKELEHYGVKRSRLAVVPPFHKISDFLDCKDDEKIKLDLINRRNTKKIIFVGRILPHKGIIHLIEVIREYLNKYSNDIYLNIIGSMSDKDFSLYYKEIYDLINKYNLQEYIKINSNVSFSELSSFYKYSDLFLCLSQHEGFCVPLLEAQFHRLPVVAYSSSAISETLGNSGVLIDKLNYGFIAKTVFELLQSKEKYRKQQDLGYENYCKFEIEKLKKIFLGHIAGLIDEKS